MIGFEPTVVMLPSLAWYASRIIGERSVGKVRLAISPDSIVVEPIQSDGSCTHPVCETGYDAMVANRGQR